VIKVDNTSKEPIHYQIARTVKDECEKRGIGPEWFAYDATAEGGALGSIIAREWSPLIMSVAFGGRASENPVSEINPRPAREEYYNRVTELWFRVRTLVTNGQIRGMDDSTATEFCKRTYEMRGMLIMVQTKTDMKALTGESPDLADSAAIAVELFRKKMNLMGYSGIIGKKMNDRFLEFARKMDVASPDNYLIEAE